MSTTTSGTAKVTLPADNQIHIRREFNAPKHLVWRAYTTPELVKRWWAGEKGTVTGAEIDLRPGGRWRYVMEANGGFEVAFHGEYREVQAPDRISYTEVFEGIPNAEDHASLVTVTITETDGRSSMDVLCEYVDRTDRDAVIDSGMESGMQESMDQLERVAVSLA